MERDEQPSNAGAATGSAFGENFEESPPLPFPHRDSEHHRHYSPDERLGAGAVGGVNNGGTSTTRDDASSCVVVLVTFWVFAMTLIFGVYASETLRLGPNSSILINPNHLLVHSIKVVELDAAKGSMLYGFYKIPHLDIVVNWSETHKVTLPASTHKEWVYYLNEGSHINVSFSVDSPSSSPLVLVIARGKDDLTKWLEDPSSPSTTFSWNIIDGNGSIQMVVSTSSTYYIAVGNLNSEVVKVELETRVMAFLYNTTEPYYKCTPSNGPCGFQLSFLGGNAAVLASPGRKSDMVDGDWYVRISYEPRWFTYLVGIGGMTVVVLAINYILNHVRSTEQEMRRDQPGGMESERSPLLPHKDNGLSSRVSSSASISEEEEYIENALAGAVLEGKLVKDEEYGNSSRRLCAICFDAPRNCFFIPCGHCVACLGCATRIAETSGDCPICRRQIIKVKKIYTV